MKCETVAACFKIWQQDINSAMRPQMNGLNNILLKDWYISLNVFFKHYIEEKQSLIFTIYYFCQLACLFSLIYSNSACKLLRHKHAKQPTAYWTSKHDPSGIYEYNKEMIKWPRETLWEWHDVITPVFYFTGRSLTEALRIAGELVLWSIRSWYVDLIPVRQCQPCCFRLLSLFMIS